MDLTPDNGPVTGETLLDIHGIDFINTEDVLVRMRNPQTSVKILICSRHHVRGLGCPAIGSRLITNSSKTSVA